MLPTVHHDMGGVPTNLRTGVPCPTEQERDAVVPGLVAVGEAACISVHGANRLGTNPLLDLTVFGRAPAHRASEVIKPSNSQASATGEIKRLLVDKKGYDHAKP